MVSFIFSRNVDRTVQNICYKHISQNRNVLEIVQHGISLLDTVLNMNSLVSSSKKQIPKQVLQVAKDRLIILLVQNEIECDESLSDKEPVINKLKNEDLRLYDITLRLSNS
jgi:hypothetical protein